MPNNSKTYILDDQWTDKDALDFTPYVETLADIVQIGNTYLPFIRMANLKSL